MSDILPIPPEDQGPWADFLGLEPVRYVCDRCHLPAVRTAGGWLHAETADAAFCALVFGSIFGTTELGE